MNSSLALIAPSPRQLARAFLRPSNSGSPSTLDFLPGAQRMRIPGPAGQVAAATAGEGPAVLLVHGWEGQASDLAAFAPALLNSGYRVVAIDLPAHGASHGSSTSIPASAQALLPVAQALGPFHAVIAHSIGTAVTVEAMAAGLPAGRVALLAAPARYLDYARGFAAQAGLTPDQTDEMIEALGELGIDVRAVSMPRRARALEVPALFVHSNDDRIVPVSDAIESVASWSGARLMRVDGLGHRRLLKDPSVVDAVIRFVAAPTGVTTSPPLALRQS